MHINMYVPLKTGRPDLHEEAKIHFETGGCSSGNGFSARYSSREYGHYV